jgi:glyoxylase-like metal-dependent hydrolase (beta-lactamase superfamily II)
MIEDIRTLTDKPVRYVVTTHWHPDHLFGNQAYRDAYPGVTFLAHEETRRLAALRDPKYVESQRKASPAKYRDVLAKNQLPDGSPLPADARAQIVASLPAIEQCAGDTEVDLVLPTSTFKDEVTLKLGKREVRVMHLGRANTAGDALVYVPDAKVLATGDVVVAPTPYAFDAYFAEWLEVLRKIEAIDARVIVPGHGPVMHDLAYVTTLEQLVTSVRAQVAEAVKRGATLEETRAKVDIEPFRRSLAGDDAARNAELKSAFTVPGIARAYQEATGKLEEE